MRERDITCLDMAAHELVLSVRVIVRHRGYLWLLAARSACGMAGHPITVAGAVGHPWVARHFPAAQQGSSCCSQHPSSLHRALTLLLSLTQIQFCCSSI